VLCWPRETAPGGSGPLERRRRRLDRYPPALPALVTLDVASARAVLLPPSVRIPVNVVFVPGVASFRLAKMCRSERRRSALADMGHG
jgi:hypothetical protein